MTASRVAVIIVTWNSAGHLAQAVRSVPEGVPVVVVDNGSVDGSVETARLAGARVLEAGSNLGFGPACNAGADATAPSETILFLNPDAALVDGRACIETLLAALEGEPAVAGVVPALTGEGQERFQLRKLPTLGTLAREAFLVNRLFPENRGFRSERYLDRPRDVPFDVEQPAAAALLVRRDVFTELGGFDPTFAPAWFEDVDFCARLVASGRRLRFVPSARATHVGGSARNALPYRDFLPLYTRNLLRYLRKHEKGGTRVAARGILGLGAFLRLALLPIVRGDHERRDAAGAYIRVLAGLLGLGWRSALLRSERGG